MIAIRTVFGYLVTQSAPLSLPSVLLEIEQEGRREREIDRQRERAHTHTHITLSLTHKHTHNRTKDEYDVIRLSIIRIACDTALDQRCARVGRVLLWGNGGAVRNNTGYLDLRCYVFKTATGIEN